MIRKEAEKIIGERVTAWTSANGKYVGTLVKVIPSRPWRGVVKVTGVIKIASYEILKGRHQRRGFRIGEEINVGGVNIELTDDTGIDYLDALKNELKWLKDQDKKAGSKDKKWIPLAMEAREDQIKNYHKKKPWEDTPIKRRKSVNRFKTSKLETSIFD